MARYFPLTLIQKDLLHDRHSHQHCLPPDLQPLQDSGVIFGNASFKLTDKISSDICSLCVDTTTKLSKEGDKRGTKSKPNDEEWGFFRWCTKGGEHY
jgi:hypothetical protein